VSVQIIEKDGRPEWAVIPFDEYERLIEACEDAGDIQAIQEHVAEPGEMIPGEVVDRLIDGENAIQVWREHRGLTQKALADAAGISKGYLSQLESGSREGTVTVLQRIAKVLNIDLNLLVWGA
jgi:DNA-binding XRE family transcriptional regulator